MIIMFIISWKVKPELCDELSVDENNKAKYRELCKTENSIQLYSKDWWLDAVCGENNWDVKLIESNGKIIAAWPIYIKKKWGVRAIVHPKMTPYMGVWMKYPEGQNYINRLSFEIDICNQLISQLPEHAYFSQAFNFEFKNWMSFYWQKFNQTTHYTYIVEDTSNWEKLYQNFSKEYRSRLRKAEKSLQIKFDLSPEDFYAYHKHILEKIDKKINYSFDLFKRIHDAVLANNCGKIIYAIDEKNTMVGASFIAWDNGCGYAITGAYDREHNASGASSFLYLEAMKYTSAFVNKYDLGWTMSNTLGLAKRHYGATQTPIHHITKFRSKFIRIGALIMNSFLK